MNPEKKRRLSELSQSFGSGPGSDDGSAGAGGGSGAGSGPEDAPHDAQTLAVLRQQKDAAVRELQVQRQTLTDFDRRCRALEARLARQTHYAAWIDRVWRQALIELDRVARKLAPTADEAPAAAPSFLPYVAKPEPAEGDAATPTANGADEPLRATVERTESELAAALRRLEAWEQQRAAGGAQAPADTQAYIAQLEAQHRQTTARLLEIEASLTEAQAAAEAATSRADELTVELEQARRRAERQAALAAQAAAQAAAHPPASGSAAAGPGAQNEASSPTRGGANHQADSLGLSLQDELELAKSLAADRLQEVAALRAQKEALVKQVDKYRIELMELPVSVVENSPAYKALLQSYEAARKETAEARAAEAELRRQLDQLLAARHNFIEEMEKQKNERETALTTELRNAQNEIIRLRSDRDNLRLNLDQANMRLRPAESLAQDSQALADQLSIHCALKEENKSLKAQLLELRTAGLGDRPEMALLRELESIGQAMEKLQEQNKQLLRAIKDRDEASARVFAERAKLVQSNALLTRERDLIKAKLDSMRKSELAKEDLRAAAEALSKTHVAQLGFAARATRQAAYEQELEQRAAQIEAHKAKAVTAYEARFRVKALFAQAQAVDTQAAAMALTGEVAYDSTQQVAELQTRLERHQARINEIAAGLAERTAVAEREQHNARRLQEELQVARRRLEKLDRVAATSMVTDDKLRMENEILLEKVKCSVCKRNDKDVVIARCFHCFCESCIKARLDTRQRKCPTCGETFGKDDVQKIYLNA